jgi:hypothetical protein
MIVRPCSITTARIGVATVHRHRAVPPPGGLAAWEMLDASLWPRGWLLVGRPASRHLQQQGWAEVTRCAVTEGQRNACSALYGAAARWARQKDLPLTTYTLRNESGSSLRGAGWVIVAVLKPRSGLGWQSRSTRQPTDKRAKLRWVPPWVFDLPQGAKLSAISVARPTDPR